MRRTRTWWKTSAILVSLAILAVPAQAGLILYYAFDGNVGPGGTVVNLANPGTYDGTLQGDAFTNGVLNLDGTGDFVQTALPTNNLGSPVTFSFWMNAAAVVKSPTISGYLAGNPNRWDIQLNRLGDGKIGFIAHEGSYLTASTTTIQPSTLYHIAVVHDLPAGTAKIYVNGTLEKTGTIVRGLQTGINLMLGKGDGAQFSGTLDDVAIWNNEALSAGQIKGIAQNAAVAIVDGDWSTPGTWFRLPGAGVNAVVAGGRSVTISSGTAEANDLILGASGESATFNLTGGTLNLAGNVTRYSAGGNATLNFNGGTLNLGGSSITVDHFNLGTASGANAQFTLASGKTLSTDTLAVGGQGTGTLNFSGAGLSANRITVGPGGTINVSASWTYTKTLESTGGLISVPAGALFIDAGAQATLGGTGQISILYGYVGYATSPLSTFTQTGGTFSVRNDLAVGRQGSAVGLYTLEDGLLEVGTAPRGSPALRVGRAATGTFTQRGGTVRIDYGGLSLGEEGGNGTYDFEGGVLTTPLIRGGTGTSAFNWTGGTLHATNVNFALDNLGTGVLAPGASVGKTTILGDYHQGPDASYQVEIAGRGTPGTAYDQVVVQGNATLAGSLAIDLLGSFNPVFGDTFDVLTATGAITLAGLTLTGDRPLGLGWDLWVIDQPGGAGQILRLGAVPEPGSLLLAALGLLGMAVYRHSRRDGRTAHRG